MVSAKMTKHSSVSASVMSSYNPIVAGSGQIYIRPYQGSDSEQVRELFRTTVSTSNGSLLRAAMRAQIADRNSMLLYTVGISALCLLAISTSSSVKGRYNTAYLGQVMLFAAVATFLNRAYGLYSSFMKFIHRGLTGDLLDVAKHYGVDDPLLAKAVSIRDGFEDIKIRGKNGFWVAELREDDGSSYIVGCTGIDISTRNEPSSAELRRMAVSPICRRRGVAAQLIKVALGHAKEHGIKSVYLTTSVYQTSALKLYQKFGWVMQRRYSYLGYMHVTDLKLDLE